LIAHVYKPRRKNAAGKSVPARLYRGRYRLEGDFAVKEVALGTSDKQTAEKKLRDVIKEKERERAGIIAPASQRVAAKTPLHDHLQDFLGDLRSLKRDVEYIERLETRINRLLTECRWTFAQDISGDSFGLWRSHQESFAPKTLNDHLDAVRALLNWMIDRQRIITNPLARVKKVDTRGKQQERRAFAKDEFVALLKAANPNRRLVYLTAAYTGLRKSELIGLVWGDIRFETDHAYIWARAVTTKDSKDAALPLHPQLAAMLKEARPVNAALNTPVFPKMRDISHAIRRDIERGGIERIDTMGRKLDFHALRYTFATNLAVKGANQRTTQELMRHSDPKLTAKVYTDPKHLPTFSAVESLPWLTVTNDSEDGTHPQIAPQKSDAEGLFLSHTVTTAANDNASEPAGSEAFGHDLSQSDLEKNWRPHGDSNPGCMDENHVSWTWLDDRDVDQRSAEARKHTPACKAKFTGLFQSWPLPPHGNSFALCMAW